MSEPPATSPNAGRFQKGQSGNPRGRPGKSVESASSAFDIIVQKTLTVTRNGQPREITMEEALQHRTYQDAIAGKSMAIREVLKWIEKREAFIVKNSKPAQPVTITFQSSPDPDNADAAFLALGIARENSERADLKLGRKQLLLEPWVVKAALTRRRGGKAMTEKDLADVRRCTRDPGSLTWPHGVNE